MVHGEIYGPSLIAIATQTVSSPSHHDITTRTLSSPSIDAASQRSGGGHFRFFIPLLPLFAAATTSNSGHARFTAPKRCRCHRR
jgi:hypothetical protein